ncbi:MAG: hypothetical protein NTV06_00060, partial [candidate division Zixibacteria bacterium]|nr:hypothetical protein [candidate division Zixibacteria bacterium]
IFTVHSIKNPRLAGDYQISGLIFDKSFKITFGPTMSETFTIYPDRPISLSISPSEPVTLRAGLSQFFTVFGYDRFGNQITGLEIRWSLSPDYDEIGIISDGNFLATTVGMGKIVTAYKQLVISSGLISVIPGDLDHFSITAYPESARVGKSFESPVSVSAYDKFSNLKTDFNDSVYFTSSDNEAAFYYNGLRKYHFIPTDSGRHSFDGSLFTLYTVGRQNITVTDGTISATSGWINLLSGSIASFTLQGADSVLAGEPYETNIINAIDSFGNPYSGQISLTLVVGDSSPAGFKPIINDIYLNGGYGSSKQYLYAVGGAVLRASVDSIYREISVIVLPGLLESLKFDIQPTQFIGNPLFGPATIIAYDKYGNLKIDFDASLNPIDLSVDRGELNRQKLDSASDFISGVADLTSKHIIFNGDAGAIKLTISTADISAGQDLIYNGISVNLNKSLPDSLYVGQELSLRLIAANKGNQTPLSPTIFANYFLSCGERCRVTAAIMALNPMESRAFSSRASTNLLMANTKDTLRLVMESKYIFRNDTIVAVQYKDYPIQILDNLSLGYLPNTLSIDTVLSPSVIDSLGMQFELNRNIQQTESLILSLSIDRGNGIWVPLNSYGTMSRGNGRIFSCTVSALAIPDFRSLGDFTEGYKHLRVELNLIDTYLGRIYTTTLDNFDSLYLLFKAKINYSPNSLSPRKVSAGSNQSFEFDVKYRGTVATSLISPWPKVQLLCGTDIISFNLSAYPSELKYGNYHFSTEKILIPSHLAGKELTPRLILNGTELYTARTDTILFGEDKIQVGILPQIKITSTDPIMINPPYINYAQSFSLKVHIANLSDEAVPDLLVAITSIDGQDTLSTSSGHTLPPDGGIDVQLPMIADTVSIPIKLYKAGIWAPNASILPPDNNTAAVAVQSPAEIELWDSLSGSYNGYLDFDQPFSIAVQLKNRGEATALDGEVMLTTDGHNFGIPDSSRIVLSVNTLGQWPLVAPAVATSDSLKVAITRIPIDKNTGLPARVKIGTTSIPIIVESGEAVLLVDGIVNPTPLIIEGATKELFTLNLKNSTENPLNTISLKSIDIRFADKKNNSVSPDAILLMEGSGFYDGNNLISDAQIVDNSLRLNFSDFSMAPKAERTIVFKAKFREKIGLSGFSIQIENGNIRAIFISGPKQNQAVPVRGKYSSNFRIDGTFVVTPRSLGESLMIKNNPFNPNRERAEIAYNLESDADVSMKIYTLTGEKVYAADFLAGINGGKQGSNYITWDGRNDEGKIVLNGVYAVIIRNNSSGLSFIIKLAVMK